MPNAMPSDAMPGDAIHPSIHPSMLLYSAGYTTLGTVGMTDGRHEAVNIAIHTDIHTDNMLCSERAAVRRATHHLPLASRIETAARSIAEHPSRDPAEQATPGPRRLDSPFPLSMPHTAH